MMLMIILLLVVALGIAGALIFTIESIREQEPRAPKVGLISILVLLGLGVLILFQPAARIPFAIAMILAALFGVLFFIPVQSRTRSLKGAMGYSSGTVKRFDQRDTVFARNQLQPESEIYKEYYRLHPDSEESDAARRALGGALGRAGAIDHHYRPNVEMMKMNFLISSVLAPHASGFRLPPGAGSHLLSDPNAEPVQELMAPHKATEIIKGYAKRLGADLVGICKVNPNWAYSYKAYSEKGLEEWGKKVNDPLPYAVVIATEMHHENVMTSPHTSAEVECAYNYAQGSIISTAIAQWFTGMGYKAKAHHNRTYDLIMPPMAVDAGLGELGRFGYVITDKFGPRVRIFACTTDMPLVPDPPVDLGAEEFCEHCLKCATTCPSRSIPEGDQIVFNGIKKMETQR